MSALREVEILHEETLEGGVEIILVGGPHDGERHRLPSECPHCGAETYQFVVSCCAKVYEVVPADRRAYYLPDPLPHSA